MLEETAIVVKKDQHRVWITATQNSSCSACAQKAACGSNALAEALPSKRPVVVQSDLPVKVGDTVVVAIEESLLLRASLLMYMLPLLAMLTVAIGADCLFTGKVQYAQIWIAGSSLMALLLSLIAIHLLQKGFGGNACPISIRVKNIGTL